MDGEQEPVRLCNFGWGLGGGGLHGEKGLNDMRGHLH